MTQRLKILVVVGSDYDNTAMIPEVSAIAGPSGAQVTLLGTRDQPPDDPETQVALPYLQRWSIAVQSEILEKSRMELEQAGIAATIQKAGMGRAYEEIIRSAVTGGYDLIMKPAANNGGTMTTLFGNRDMQLFRLSQDPVWIFKPTPANKLERILVAVDPLAYDKEKSALAAKVLRWGKKVADTVGAKLHVVHSWDLYREMGMRGKVGPQPVERLLHALEERHRKWLDDAIAQSEIDARKITIHFYKGDAQNIIPAITRSQNIDLLVMGTVGRTGIPGFFIGNTADAVLRQVNCSVLAIKPDGFQTPIKIGN